MAAGMLYTHTVLPQVVAMIDLQGKQHASLQSELVWICAPMCLYLYTRMCIMSPICAHIHMYIYIYIYIEAKMAVSILKAVSVQGPWVFSLAGLSIWVAYEKTCEMWVENRGGRPGALERSPQHCQQGQLLPEGSRKVAR